MSLHKNVARNWSISLLLLMTLLAWADNKPRSSPSPRPAAAPKAAPAARQPAKANTGTAPSQHPASTGSGVKYGSPTTSHPAPAAHAGSTSTPHAGSTGGTHAGSTGGTHFGSTGGTHSGRTGPATTKTFSNGTTARFSAGGRIQSIRTANGVSISRSVGGQRTIVSRSNGRTLVSTGANSGYSQRAYMNRNGRVYVQRTYVIGGRTSVYVYNRFAYRGFHYYGYVPGFYFRPAFYGWAYNPWVTPVYYRWNWWGAAWFAPYGYYFAPAPYYPVASLWLTDYLLAESLRAAYDAGAAAQPPAPSGPPPDQSAAQTTVLTPEIKQAIAEEVKRQIDAERAAAESQPPAAAPTAAPAATPAPAPAAQVVAEQRPEALDPAVSVFVVSANLDVNAGEQACSLSPGDVIMRIDDTPDAKQNVSVKVASSKRSDCPTGQKVAIAVADLQEMHNQFRAKIDSGLKTLADNQGKNGLPPAPDTQTSAGEVPQPQPDAVRADLQKLQAVADQTEADVKRQSSSTGTT